ncbi:MAG: ATP-binding cassette domain-containing protein [Bdellovibrionales bacterium]|nr:ATP-binding cassette domain-containing protein [Bdellovibrionales bacterium]
MLQVIGLSKGFGSQVLFENISFNLNPGERLGVVGRNGHGKSTLFRLLLGQESIDSGSIKLPRDYRLGHLSQKLVFSEKNVLSEACLGLPELEGGWKEVYKAETVLHGLGFSDHDFRQCPLNLSGGFQIRLNLAKLLVSEPNLLLLDEPTNYLDIPSVRWLIRFLNAWPDELMLITHDRGFMDQVTTHTLAIHRGSIKKVEGNTTKLYEQIATEEELHEKTRINQLKKREKTEEFINRFRAKASKASAVQSRVKALEKIESLDQLMEVAALSFRFNSLPFQGRYICSIKDLSFGFDRDKMLISDFSLSIRAGERIGVIGQNGKGKTTLLNLLAGEFQPSSGAIAFSENAKLAYFGQTNVERLDPEKTIESEVSEANPSNSRTHTRNICGAMMFGGDLALKKIKVLSGGERSRVLLAKVLAQPCNILLLDEPTNHLDMESSEELREAISDFSGAVMFVTHDEILLRQVATRLIVFDRERVCLFDGGYDDFLGSVGWNAEGTEEASSLKPSVRKLDSKNQQARNKKIRKEKLKPLERKMAKIENQIISLEELQKKEQDELIEITRSGYGADAVKLTRLIAEKQKRIDELFLELEELSEEHQRVLSEI